MPGSVAGHQRESSTGLAGLRGCDTRVCTQAASLYQAPPILFSDGYTASPVHPHGGGPHLTASLEAVHAPWGSSGREQESRQVMAKVVRDASSGSPERDASARLVDVQVVDAGDAPNKVAVLCAQDRLRTILRLSLQADDHDVVEWNHRSVPDDPSVAVIVIDLDSLGHDVPGMLDLLDTWGVDESTSLLFISVYPLDLTGTAGRPVRRRCSHPSRPLCSLNTCIACSETARRWPTGSAQRLSYNRHRRRVSPARGAMHSLAMLVP